MPRRLLCIVALVLPVHLAFANVGTPLMWATVLHLVLGNLFIGLLEASCLRLWFGVPWARAIPLLLLANYGSAWLGAILLDHVPTNDWGLTIENLPTWFAGFIFAAFLLTLIIEFPAFLAAFKPADRSCGRVLRATVVTHGFSYLLLGAFYWSASGTTMLTRLQVVPPHSLFVPSPTVEAHTGFWPIDGIHGYESNTGWRFRYSLELPWIAWSVRNAAHLPGDFVLFQLGADQLCRLDPRQGRIALIARGFGPVLASSTPAPSSFSSAPTP